MPRPQFHRDRRVVRAEQPAYQPAEFPRFDRITAATTDWFPVVNRGSIAAASIAPAALRY